jgi:hypothetical protein
MFQKILKLFQGLFRGCKVETEGTVVRHYYLLFGGVNVVHMAHAHNQAFAYADELLLFDLSFQSLRNVTQLQGYGAFLPVTSINVRVVSVRGDINQPLSRNADEFVTVGKCQVLGHGSVFIFANVGEFQIRSAGEKHFFSKKTAFTLRAGLNGSFL